MNAFTLSVTAAVKCIRTFTWKPPFSAKHFFLLFFLHICKTNLSPLSLILWMGSLKLTSSEKKPQEINLKKKNTKKNHTHTHKIYVHPKDICLTSLALQHHSFIFPPQILTFSNLLYRLRENRNDTNGQILNKSQLRSTSTIQPERSKLPSFLICDQTNNTCAE